MMRSACSWHICDERNEALRTKELIWSLTRLMAIVGSALFMAASEDTEIICLCEKNKSEEIEIEIIMEFSFFT